MNKIKLMTFKALFIILGLLLSQQAFAMKCIKSQNSNFDIANIKPNEKEHRNTTSEVNIIADNEKDVIVWRADYSTTFTCYDNELSNENEPIKIRFDDLSGITTEKFKNTNLSVGIIYNGKEYIIDKNTSEIDTGINGIEKAKNDNVAENNCKNINLNGKCATPQTITINYSLFFKSKSGAEKLKDGTEFTIFRIGGEKTDSDDFSEWINLSDVTYIECVPHPTSKDVYLGEYKASSPLNKPLEKVPFTINIVTNGNECAGTNFMANMIPFSLIDNDTIGTDKENVGIQIYEEDDSKPLKFNNQHGGSYVDFGYATGNNISKTLYASVIFTDIPEAGKFTGIINYQLWIK